MASHFTVRTNTRNNGGIDTRYGRVCGQWSVEFEKDGIKHHLMVGWESNRSVRQMLAEDHGINIDDAKVQFLRG